MGPQYRTGDRVFQHMRWRRHCSNCDAVRPALSVAICTLAWGPAVAQGQGEPSTVLERVVVTGSHIRQTDVETALPMQVLTREDIEKSGVTTVEQLLERVPANVNPFNLALTIGNGANPGLSAANLRGLGGGSTLVPLNGRRLGNYAFDGASVDLNSIPFAAIERVEVLKDGASAIYGTDAIAGVINFILRARSDAPGTCVPAIRLSRTCDRPSKTKAGSACRR